MGAETRHALLREVAGTGVRIGRARLTDQYATSVIGLDRRESSSLARLMRATHSVLVQGARAVSRRPNLRDRLIIGPRSFARLGERWGVARAARAAAWSRAQWIYLPKSEPFPITTVRIDGFLVDGLLRAFEFNVGPFRWSYLDLLAAAFARTPGVELPSESEVAPAVGSALVDAILRRHRELFGARPPFVAVVDAPVARGEETTGLVEEFRDRGVDARLVERRRISGRLSTLRSGGGRVTALVDLSDGITNQGRFSSLSLRFSRLWAHRAGQLVLYSAPTTGIFNKAFLALISDGSLDGFVDEAALDQVKEHLVWTRQTHEGPTTWIDGRFWDLRDLATANRRDLVLKPDNSFGGESVLYGDAVDSPAWLCALDAAFRARDSVLQLRIRPPKHVIVTAKDLQSTEVLLDTCPIGIEGKLAGVLTRFSQGLETNFHRNQHIDSQCYGLVPTWTA